jgi:HEPN domain-containing protein
MSDADNGQPQRLADLTSHWFELFDQSYTCEGVPLSDRPLRAILELLRSGAAELRFGDDALVMGEPWEHAATPWFRALYTGAERWYVERYGVKAMKSKGNPPLRGVTLVRGTPFLVNVPMHRKKVEQEGRLAWMYFEDRIGDGEDPMSWVQNRPNYAKLEESQRASDVERLHEVCNRLRGINYRLLGAKTDDVSKGFRQAVRSYLESAADRIQVGELNGLAFAWFDLQMAIEAALKLAHHTILGSYAKTHDIKGMLSALEQRGVSFDQTRLADWPQFAEMSDLRYAQSPPGNVATLFDAYQLALDVVLATLSVLRPALGPGAGFLIKRPPWLLDDPN